MKRAFALVAASAAILTACGTDGDEAAGAPGDEQRTIEVAMTDMAFTPNEIDVAPGETVTFVFRNDGTVRHEAVFGNLVEQEAHHAEMAEMGEMGESHDGIDMGSGSDEMTELHSVIVEPGDTLELVHTFEAASTMIGCHEPGHWEAGMKLDFDV
jgi:uncharacterized cupredoxin-like copper-binding protein